MKTPPAAGAREQRNMTRSVEPTRVLTTSQPLSPEQQRRLDAYRAANPALIRVFDIKPLTRAGGIIAVASVGIRTPHGELVVHGCKIIRNKNGDALWAKLPDRPSKPDPVTGKSIWFPVAEADGNLKKMIEDALLEAWAKRGS